MEGGNNPVELYAEIAYEDFEHRGTIVPVRELDKYILHALESDQQMFRSYYLFDDNIIKWKETHAGSLKGFTGPFYVDQITLDVDKGNLSHDQVLHQARLVERRLLELSIPEDAYQTWYSGSGYHFTMSGDLFAFPSGRSTTPQIVRETLTRLFPEADPIYDGTRLLRVGGTRNSKTGLYKTLLSRDLFRTGTYTEIKALCSGTQKLPPPVPVAEPLPNLAHYVDAENSSLQRSDALAKRRRSEVLGVGRRELDVAAKFVTCMQTVYERGPITGQRHIEVLRMASAFRRGGIPRAGVENLMFAWDPTFEKEEVLRLVDSVYTTPLRFSCSDPVMAANCHPACVYFKNKNYGLEVSTPASMEQRFIHQVRTQNHSNSLNIPALFGIGGQTFKMDPGEFVCVLGDTGLGKTAFVQNICVQAAPMKVLYLSLEVHETLLYRRFVQISQRMSKYDVEEHYRLSPEISLATKLHHVQAMTTSPNLTDLDKLIVESGANLVVVDTLDGVTVDFARDETEKTLRLALKLKEAAQKHSVIIVAVHHIRKSALNDGQTLNVHSGKGSSSIEQKADRVIGISGEQHKKLRRVESFKARDDGQLSQWFEFDFDTFVWKPVNFAPGGTPPLAIPPGGGNP